MEPRRILIAPLSTPRYEIPTSNQMLALVAALANLRLDLRVTLIAHDHRQNFDSGYLDRVRSAMSLKNVDFVTPGSLAEIIRLYEGADYVLSARMHPLIFAFVFGGQPIGLAGSEKVEAFAQGLRLPVVAPDVPNPDLEKLILQPPTSSATRSRDRERLRAAAWQNLDLLCSIWSKWLGA